MQTPEKTVIPHPLFPAALSLPLKMLPSAIHNRALVTAINKLFKQDLAEGELNFLQDRIIHIIIEDIAVECRLTLNRNKLMSADNRQHPDLVLKGTVYDFLLLASRREDTDTLFFSRRLHMQGDTELGLYLKNFLDGMDMDSHRLPAYLGAAIQKILPVYERLLS
jgi:O2-independent ubiquinone biosynthesis accessory factor UbiT